jgi:hypothetical protein
VDLGRFRTVERDAPASAAMVLVDQCVDESEGSVVLVSLMIFSDLVLSMGSRDSRSWCVTERSHPIEGEFPYPL